MKRNKVLFLIFAVVFFLLVFYIAYDMSQRTTFPGRKNTPPEDTVKVQENN